MHVIIYLCHVPERELKAEISLQSLIQKFPLHLSSDLMHSKQFALFKRLKNLFLYPSTFSTFLWKPKPTSRRLFDYIQSFLKLSYCHTSSKFRTSLFCYQEKLCLLCLCHLALSEKNKTGPQTGT